MKLTLLIPVLLISALAATLIAQQKGKDIIVPGKSGTHIIWNDGKK